MKLKKLHQESITLEYCIMVNVKQHKVFPTIINEFEFDMDEQEYNLVIDELNDMEKFGRK